MDEANIPKYAEVGFLTVQLRKVERRVLTAGVRVDQTGSTEAGDAYVHAENEYSALRQRIDHLMKELSDESNGTMVD